jgi:hypothetical protein
MLTIQQHRGVVGQALLVGDHVDHHRIRLNSRCSTVGMPAATRQPIGPVADGAQRVGTPLIDGAWIGVAHRAGHRLQPLVQGGGVVIEQHRLDRGGAAAVGWAYLDTTAAGARLRAPQRIRVVAIHPVIDLVLDFGLRQPTPSTHRGGQLDVDLRPRLGVGHQRGAEHDHRHDTQTDPTAVKHLVDARQPLTQRHGDHQLMARDPQRHLMGGGDLAGHGIPVVQTPLLPLGRPVSRPARLQHVGYRRQPPRTRRVLHPRPRPHRSTSRRGRGLRSELIEHAFETTGRLPTQTTPSTTACG